MPTLTIRNLDESLKSRLRIRAAAKGRSMEEEVRQILRIVLSEQTVLDTDLAGRIRARFAHLGDIDLPIPPRDGVREPPHFDETATRPPARRRRQR